MRKCILSQHAMTTMRVELSMLRPAGSRLAHGHGRARTKLRYLNVSTNVLSPTFDDGAATWWHLDWVAQLVRGFSATTNILNFAGLPAEGDPEGLCCWRPVPM